MAQDQWVSDYEAAKESANDTLSIIQERNLKHPDGGPEASRITAAARRKLGTLGTLLDSLRTSLESPQYDKLWVLLRPLPPWCQIKQLARSASTQTLLPRLRAAPRTSATGGATSSRRCAAGESRCCRL